MADFWEAREDVIDDATAPCTLTLQPSYSLVQHTVDRSHASDTSFQLRSVVDVLVHELLQTVVLGQKSTVLEVDERAAQGLQHSSRSHLGALVAAVDPWGLVLVCLALGHGRLPNEPIFDRRQFWYWSSHPTYHPQDIRPTRCRLIIYVII